MSRGNDVKLSTLKSNGIFLFNYAWLNLCFKTPMCVRLSRPKAGVIALQRRLHLCAEPQLRTMRIHTVYKNFCATTYRMRELQSRNFTIPCYFLINSSPHRTLASALSWCFYILLFQKQSAKRHSAYLRLFFHPSVLFTAQSGQDLVFLCLQSFFWWNSTEIFAFNSLLLALSPFTKWTSLKATVAFNCLFSSGGEITDAKVMRQVQEGVFLWQHGMF